MRKALVTVALATAVLLVGAPVARGDSGLPPDGPAPTCWVDAAWFPNPDALPPCPADAQPTLYQFARAIVGWEGMLDIVSSNARALQRANARKYHRIKRLERRVRHLRAELTAANR